MESIDKIQCFNCKKELDVSPGQRIMRTDECQHCYGSIHCCKMCQFYDQSAYNECRESSADRTVEKEKSNFCDYYILKEPGANENGQESHLEKANSLFKF